MKHHRNDRGIALLKEFDSYQNCCCHGNKTEKKYRKALKIFYETTKPRNTKFILYLRLVNLYKKNQILAPRSILAPYLGSHVLHRFIE